MTLSLFKISGKVKWEGESHHESPSEPVRLYAFAVGAPLAFFNSSAFPETLLKGMQ